MLQRPDPQSFSKFLASLGLFLCALGLLAPALVLRETDVLRISRHDLGTYTPLARKELERRQLVSREVGRAAPWVGGAVFLVGVGVLLYAVPRLKRQESKDDERVQAELDKLKRDITPQDEAERRARIQAEVADEARSEESRAKGEEISTSGGDADSGPPDGAEEDVAAEKMAERAYEHAALMERVANAEEAVLQQIARIAPPLYQFRPQIKVGGHGVVLLDGLLVSEIDQLPDVVVEIKWVKNSSNLARRVRNALPQLQQNLASEELHGAKGWLIFVTEGDATVAQLDRVAEFAAAARDDVTVSVVNTTSVGQLELPRDRFI